jgi:hypothetical protein
MSKIKKILNSIGFCINIKDEKEPYDYDPEDYKLNNDKAKIEAHKEFLKNLSSEENDRLTLIESKTSQLISQTGIIFSLLSLFVPILIDKIAELSFLIKLTLLILLVLAFLFYMLTIRNALKNFNIKKFGYSSPAPKNVLTLQDENLNQFYAEEVKDLLYSINLNVKLDNRKATNLLHSYNAFKIANTFTGILVVAFSILFLFFKPKAAPTTIENIIKIEHLDSVSNKSHWVLKDTSYCK